MGFCGGSAAGGSGRLGMGVRRAMNHPDPSAIGEDCWALVDQTAQEIVNYVHPTMDSLEKRWDVTDFMQKLIRCYVPCEVFPYGSVPLKTYLPDGDIDLTALSVPHSEESLARDVLAVLQAEELNANAEYTVRDIQFIDAEVKLVRCVVQDILIDISFNQLGGLCSLCFLEQVDRIVGKNHLFKRTIMLIKCWCYYESRILGAHHGLISTYALEILVLFIFQLFHESLNSPVAVLYRFLDYYSKFDWENCGISLNGPVCKSSLPEIVVQMPDKGKNNLLLSEEFSMNCLEMFSVPSSVLESNTKVFQTKNLNIIDPLKENNNLGRSVHRGNYYRIRSAFKFGVRRLGQILLLPPDKIGGEIRKFFSNTIKRHGYKHLAHLKNSTLSIADSSGLPSPAEFFSDDDMLSKLSDGDSEHEFFELEGKCTCVLINESDNMLLKPVSKTSCLATSTNLNLSSANDTSDCPSGGSCDASSLYGQERGGLHFSSTKLTAENRSCKNKNLCQNETAGEFRPESSSACQFGKGFGSAISNPKTSILEDVSVDLKENDSASISGDSEACNPLADLTGDYDSHIRSLIYGKCCQGYALTVAMPSPYWFQNNGLFYTDQQTMTPWQQSFTTTNMNAVFVGPLLYSAGNALPSTATFNFEEQQKARGTGTFFPVMVNSFRERPFKGKGRNRGSGGHGQFRRGSSSKGWAPALPKESVVENSSQEATHAFRQSHSNGYSNSPGVAESGSLKQHSEGSSSGSSHARVSHTVQYAKPVWGRKDRLANQPLRLKNDELTHSLHVKVSEKEANIL